MKFKLTRSSEVGTSEVKINTLAELLELSKKEGCSIIVTAAGMKWSPNPETPELEIYDSYRE